MLPKKFSYMIFEDIPILWFKKKISSQYIKFFYLKTSSCLHSAFVFQQLYWSIIHIPCNPSTQGLKFNRFKCIYPVVQPSSQSILEHFHHSIQKPQGLGVATQWKSTCLPHARLGLASQQHLSQRNPPSRTSHSVSPAPLCPQVTTKLLFCPYRFTSSRYFRQMSSFSQYISGVHPHWISISLLVMAEQSATSVHSTVEGHICRFYFLAILHNDVLNIYAQVFYEKCFPLF